MPEQLQSPRSSSDEKLTAILDQLARLRLRLNALALQRALFTTLALVIGGGATLVLAALLLGPLTFLATAIVLAIALIVGLVRSLTGAWRSRVDAAATASLADRRVDFKDRLTTLVSLKERSDSSLWPYLLEETLTQRQEFGVSRVERHRVSRSLYALLISGVLASFTTTMVLAPARLGLAAKPSVRRRADASSGNLQVRPSDPALDPGAEMNGDAEATEQPGDRDQADAEAESADAPGEQTGSSKLMDKARELASALQNKLTGRKPQQRPRMKFKTTDEAKNQSKSKSGQNHSGSSSEPERLADNGSERGGQQTPNSNRGASEPGGESSQEQSEKSRPDDRMANKPTVQPSQPNPQPGSDFSNGQSEPGAGRNGTGGASHGAGTDPDHLFGRAEKPATPKDGFSITLEARLSENGPAAGGHGYVPPKVHSTLNSSQQPDEPLSRATVPDDDRQTIKRVFER